MFLRLACLVSLMLGAFPAMAQGSRPVGLLRGDDYPAEAVKRREEGTVSTRLRVSAEGRVMACAILQSATPTLDAATCRILTERARFKPSTDSSGKAIESDFDAPAVRWVLPKPEPRPKPPKQGLRL